MYPDCRLSISLYKYAVVEVFIYIYHISLDEAN